MKKDTHIKYIQNLNINDFDVYLRKLQAGEHFRRNTIGQMFMLTTSVFHQTHLNFKIHRILLHNWHSLHLIQLGCLDGSALRINLMKHVTKMLFNTQDESTAKKTRHTSIGSTSGYCRVFWFCQSEYFVWITISKVLLIPRVSFNIFIWNWGFPV